MAGFSTAVNMDQDFSTWKADYEAYFECVDVKLMPVLDCYYMHLDRTSQPAQVQSEPEPEQPSVVEEADKPTGKVIYDKGDEVYRASFTRVFPFAAVDFNKSESRDTGLGDLGLKEFVIPESKGVHAQYEPHQCFDPCFEKKEALVELRNRVEYLEWRNGQAENLLARAPKRRGAW